MSEMYTLLAEGSRLRFEPRQDDVLNDILALGKQSGDYEIAWGGWVSDYDDPYSYLELFKSDSPYNYSRYKNEKVDELLNASQLEVDAAKRMDMLHQADQIIVDDAAFLPQAEREVHYLVRDNVEGLVQFYSSINLDWVYVDMTE